MFGFQVCRICGCVDDDCRQCIERTGAPCYWIEEDLCSACEEHQDKVPVEVTCSFTDRTGKDQVATFGTWVTPGNEKEELKEICPATLDQNGFSGATITKTEYIGE